jgi:aminoglycoside phosphotransferase family enzyme
MTIDLASGMAALAAKVEFLKRAESYPGRPERVEAVETHMSWVFLTDTRAYKLKKPVRYEFLDFSTVDARRRDCEEEVRLNRRLAPDVYFGILPLVLAPGGSLQVGGSGEVVDWLVEMRRLPAERMLDYAIRNRTLEEADLHRLAALLAAFYSQCPPAETVPAAYRGKLQDAIRANHRVLRDPVWGLPAKAVERIASAQLEFLRREAALFDERVRAGKVVEAHGDLRPEHVCLEPRPVIFDCLEFNRDFRILDIADELAFLAMECARIDGVDTGRVLFDAYGRLTGDRPPARLVQFYKSHRAYLRAKIAIWHNRDREVPDPAKWAARAREYLRLAEGYIVQAVRS